MLFIIWDMNHRESPDLIEQPWYDWRGYRPGFLQCCLTSRWIAVACAFLIAIESCVVTGVRGVTITSLEKQFYLRSLQVGGISSWYEVSSVVLTLSLSCPVNREESNKILESSEIIAALVKSWVSHQTIHTALSFAPQDIEEFQLARYSYRYHPYFPGKYCNGLSVKRGF